MVGKAIRKLKPTAGYMLVEPLEEEKKTASGIVLPDSHDEKPQKGKVVLVGPTMITEYGVKVEATCKTGDMVVFKKWAGSEYKLEGQNKECLFVKFDEVLAIERK